MVVLFAMLKKTLILLNIWIINYVCDSESAKVQFTQHILELAVKPNELEDLTD